MKDPERNHMASSIMNFIEENYQSLLWFAVRMTGNWADGEDVLQTVATKICLKQDELKDIAHCKSYLMVCIRNATLNQRRTKARQRVADESYEKLKDTFSDPAIKREYEIVDRRPGDVAENYADPSLAKELLGWVAERDLVNMCKTGYHWQSMNPNGYDA